MIKQTIICDRCGKEIKVADGEKIGYVAINQRARWHGDLINNNEFEDEDFCEKCLIKIMRFVTVNELDNQLVTERADEVRNVEEDKSENKDVDISLAAVDSDMAAVNYDA